MPGGGPDESFAGLAAIEHGHADDDALGDRRMLVDRLLDIAREDLVAAGDDDVLDAVDEKEITVGIEIADIAGMQPAIDENLRRLLVLAPVAGHDLRTANADLAALAGRQQPCRPLVEADDLDGRPRHRQGARARLV